MNSKSITIDGTGHIAGRLGSSIAKKLLEGYSVTVVCAESICLTGPLERAYLKYRDFKRKRCGIKPSNGPFHYQEPSKFFIRTVKRMLPHKTKRGNEALKRLAVYEGIPKKYEGGERQVCPKALLKYKANPIRKSTTYGALMTRVGWKYEKITESLKEAALEREAVSQAGVHAQDEKRRKIINSADFRMKVEKEMSLFE